MTSYLSPAELNDSLTLRDLSNPASGPHAMQLLLQHVVDSLTAHGGVPARVVRDSPLVAVADNYDRLGFSATDVTRNRRYTRYAGPTVMLRSHTSASIPPLLDALPNGDDHDELLVLPGLVYRRDAIDRTHVGTPHQVDLWRISSGAALAPEHLESMAERLVQAVLPGATWRATGASHPYTTHGMQVDVRLDGDWLELAECGLVPARLFSEAGLDPARWTGLALGMGLDRALMLRKGIPDIRLLRAREPRIASQMLDLAPWRPVSAMPSIRRDLSVVVPLDSDGETLGDQVRRSLGTRADYLESVELLALTPHRDLPDAARTRLRLAVDQANALVRIVLRPLDRTLTDGEANAVRDDVYRALHRGPVMELIGGRPPAG
jgi:phenylalanyl-tRNA synthetase alpha chain